jgi:DNA-binding transcriptional MocR family regulator
MAIHVSLVGRKVLRGEIYRQLRAAIRTGQLRAGEYLTPSRELGQALAVSQHRSRPYRAQRNYRCQISLQNPRHLALKVASIYPRNIDRRSYHTGDNRA